MAAARRELREETGHDGVEIGAPIGGRGGTFLMGHDRWFTQYERWYLGRTQHFEVPEEVVAAGLEEGIRDIRWWSADEIRRAGIDTGPRNLPDLLDDIVAGRLPAADADLGF